MPCFYIHHGVLLLHDGSAEHVHAVLVVYAQLEYKLYVLDS
jgi:hypothetical protein